MWTGNEVAALVAGFVFALDGTDASNRWRRYDENLPARKCAGAGLGQGHRAPLTINVDRIPIDLVEKEVTHRHRAQTHGAVGPGHHQDTAAKLFRQNRIA